MALGLAALYWPKLIGPSLGLPLSAVFLAAALYLVNAVLSGAEEAPAGFTGPGATLCGRNAGRCAVSPLPLLAVGGAGPVLVQAGIISRAIAASPDKIVFHAVLAVLLCFVADAINREERGRVQEETSLLGALRETPSALA